MKKLLITSMAAVAIGLYAKADFTDNNESFEGYPNEGPLFTVNETGKYTYGEDWTSEATPADGIFTVTNISNITTEEAPYPTDRPLTGENLKALAIDTEKSLIRKAISGSDDDLEGASLVESEGGAPIFFDSVVQFTATDAKPTPGEGDKLMVWLYKSEEVSDDNKGAFGESIPTNALVVTALNNEGEMEHFLTDKVIEPDSWHRLTIKSFTNSKDDVLFNIWVDTTQVGDNFVSLLNSNDDERNLKGVAFDGKGVVDDLVFTTTAPEFAGSGEDPEENVKMTVTFKDINAIATALIDGTPQSSNSCEYQYLKGSELTIMFMLNQGYEFVSSSPEAIYNGTFYTITVKLDEEKTVTIETRLTGGGDNGPTVDDTTCATEEALKAVVKSGTAITVPSGWTVDGKVLKKADGTPFATFEYYNLALADGIVTATLDQKAAAPFAEATEGEEVLELDETDKDGNPIVGVRIKTYPGLWYGLDTATELGQWGGLGADDWVPGDGNKLQLKAAKPDSNAAFFMIKVRDTNPKQ